MSTLVQCVYPLYLAFFIKPTYISLYLPLSIHFPTLPFLKVMVSVAVAPTLMAVIIKEFAGVLTRVAPLRMMFEMVEVEARVRRTRTAMVIWSALISVVIRWMLLPP